MPAVVGSQQQPPSQSVDPQSSSVTSSSLSASPSALTLRRALPAGLPGFLVKLWSLVNDPASDAVIGWDSSGDCIQINDGNALAAELLPLYFKHNNLSSFTRQLNMYGFHKQAALDSSGQMHFQHPYFRRDRPDLLASVNRHMMSPGGRFSLAVATRGVAAPLARPPGTVGAEFNDASSSSAPASAASLSFSGGADGRDAMQAALTEMRSRQSATDEQLRRLCDENHKLWLELDNLRVQHQQQQVAVTWLLDFIKAAMVNRSAHGGHGGGVGGPIINEADLLSPGASDATVDAAIAAADAVASTAGDCLSAFSQLNRKRQAPLMAIGMRPPKAAIEGAKRLRAITQLPPAPTTPPAIDAESPDAFCPESFSADLNSRQADLNGIVNALETDNSIDFDVDQLLSELVQSPAPPPPIIEALDCAADSPLAAVTDGAAEIEPPILTSRLRSTNPTGLAVVTTASSSPGATGERPSPFR